MPKILLFVTSMLIYLNSKKIKQNSFQLSNQTHFSTSIYDRKQMSSDRQESVKYRLGASINYVDKQRGGKGSLKCQRYYISLLSKLVNEGGRSGQKFCQRSLWMPPCLLLGNKCNALAFQI